MGGLCLRTRSASFGVRVGRGARPFTQAVKMSESLVRCRYSHLVTEAGSRANPRPRSTSGDDGRLTRDTVFRRRAAGRVGRDAMFQREVALDNFPEFPH